MAMGPEMRTRRLHACNFIARMVGLIFVELYGILLLFCAHVATDEAIVVRCRPGNYNVTGCRME